MNRSLFRAPVLQCKLSTTWFRERNYKFYMQSVVSVPDDILLAVSKHRIASKTRNQRVAEKLNGNYFMGLQYKMFCLEHTLGEQTEEERIEK